MAKTKISVKSSNTPVKATSDMYLQKKPQVVKQVVVKEERAMGSASAVRYAQYMVAPYDCDTVAPAPSPVPVRETSVRQNLVVDLASYNAAGSFFIEARPHITDTLSVTTNAADVVDQSNFAGSLAFTLSSTTSNPEAGTVTKCLSGFQTNIYPIDTVNSGTKMIFPLQALGATCTFQLEMSGEFSELAQVNVSIGSVVGTTSATITSLSLLGSTSSTVSVVLPVGCTGFWFTASQPTFNYVLPTLLSFSMTYMSGGGTALATTAQTVQTFAVPLASSIKQLESWRVTAQDILVTFEGDTLNDGGAIASARVPNTWSSTGPSVYTDLLALPYDRYDGPLKKGTHVHWIPGSIDDLMPINDVVQDRDFGYFKMVVAGTITHPGSSVRVRVCTTVAYYSTDPSYGNMEWAPAPTDLGLLLHYVAAVIPAATENDTHLVKKLATFAGKNLKQGLKYLVENPAMLAKLAGMAAAML